MNNLGFVGLVIVSVLIFAAGFIFWFLVDEARGVRYHRSFVTTFMTGGVVVLLGSFILGFPLGSDRS